MKRRAFLQTSSMVSLPLLLNGLNVTAIKSSTLFDYINGDSDRVLVLINLIGGNDGLNTIIPLDQYDKLANVRSNIIIPQNELLNIDSLNAFHPNCAGLLNLYNDAKVNVIQNVAYPNQNRSHFRSTDIWTTASAADEFLTSGWLGRFFDTQFPGFPEGYPNEQTPDPIAITLGYVVSETCQGQSSNFSMAMTDPTSLTTLQEAGEGELPDNCYGNELLFIRESIKQTIAYTETIADAVEAGTNVSAKYNDEDSLAQQLKVVAQLISGGLKTKIYVVSIGGFDTHANQTVEGAPNTGVHSNLLTSLSSAVEAFQDDLKLQGLEERVLSMTFSEFGRRIRSNYSFGTDHGTAAPVMVFGSCVNPGFIGDNPEISDDVGVQDGVPMQFDFRSVYGSILMDWFEIEENDVRSILYDDFTYIPIIAGCQSTSTDNNPILDDSGISIYPNPFNRQTTLEITIPKAHVRIILYDSLGSELRVISNRDFTEGFHSIPIEGHDLVPGNYYVRIIVNNAQKTKLLQKIGW